MKKVFGLFAVGASAVTLASCGGLDYTDADYRLVSAAIAENLNSATMSMSSDFLIQNQIGEGLIRRDENDLAAIKDTSGNNTGFTISDGLAKAATRSKNEVTNEVTWTFTLRDGIKWQDGSAITANDFVFGWRQLANPANAGGYSSMADMIVGGSDVRNGKKTNATTKEVDYSEYKVTALSDTKFEVVLVEEVAYFTSLMTFEVFQPIHEDTWKKSIDSNGNVRYGKTAEYTMASGPYKIKEWNTKYGVYVEKNDQYWDTENVDVESISIRLDKDPNSQVTMFDAGDIDRVGLTGSHYKNAVSKNRDVSVLPVSTLWYLVPNLNSATMADPAVREAISYAVDLQNGASQMEPFTPASYFVPANLVKFEYEGEVVDFRDWNDVTKKYNEPYNYQQEGGKELANSALSSVTTDLSKLNFMTFNTASWENLIDAISFNLNQVDKITVVSNKKVPQSVYDTYDLNNGYQSHANTEKGKTPVISGEWDLGQYGWGPDYADPTTFLDLFKSSDSHNIIGLDQYNENSATWSGDVLQFTPAGDAAPSAQNRVVAYDENGIEMTAAQASVIYDGYMEEANVQLQAGSIEGYYNNLALAESFLLENHFVFPLLQGASGYLNNERFNLDTLVYHSAGSDYSYKYLKHTK